MKLAKRFSALAAAAVLVGIAAAPASAQPLGLESFSGDATTTGTTNCDFSQGPTESFSYSSQGTASGPYPGTYTESGTVTISGSEQAVGFHASFTISSANGTVTGTKDWSPQSTSSDAFCGPHSTENSFATIQGLSYTAQTPDGVDSGTSDLTVNSFFAGSGNTGTLDETFTSTGFTPNPSPKPRKKSDCMHRGFAKYGYENQGRCIRFVETGR